VDSTQLTLSEAMRARDASRLHSEDDDEARDIEAGHDGNGGSRPSDS
jgi:hypothetical protein